MSLGVIPIFWSEFLRVLEKKKNVKRRNQDKFCIYEPLCRSEGHPRCGKVLRHSEGLPCRSKGLPHRGEAEGPEKAALGFTKA